MCDFGKKQAYDMRDKAVRIFQKTIRIRIEGLGTLGESIN